MKLNANNIYTQAQYAKKIRQSRGHIHNLAKSGKLKTLKINGALLIIDTNGK